MSKNKTEATNQSVTDFINSSDPQKVADSFKLVEIMERLSGERATMWGPSIVGFGRYYYKYASGRQGVMCRIGFSPRKDRFSLYVLSCETEAQQTLLVKLGRIQTSKACVYFKKLDDLDLGVLERLIEQSLKETEERWG